MKFDDTSADELALRRLAYLYARGMDRNEPDIIRQIFTEDAIIESPVVVQKGIEEIIGVPLMLSKMFASTMHAVHNQTVNIDGEKARGETYGVAYQIKKTKDGLYESLDWGIRYQDRFMRTGGQWRFTHRKLIIEWTRTMPVEMLEAGR